MAVNDSDWQGVPDRLMTFAHHLADLSGAMLRKRAQGDIAIEIKPTARP